MPQDVALQLAGFAVELGAGGAVPTVRMTSERAAALLGAILIRINPREPHVPGNHIGLAMGGLEALREIDARLRSVVSHQ